MGAAVVIARPAVGMVIDIAGRWQQVCASNMWRRSLSEGVVSTPLECERAACWLLLDEANGRLYAAAGHRIKAIVPAVMQRTNLEERFAASTCIDAPTYAAKCAEQALHSNPKRPPPPTYGGYQGASGRVLRSFVALSDPRSYPRS